MSDCRFCLALKQRKKIVLSTRSTYADDNISEVLNSISTMSNFQLDGWEHNGQIYFGVSYHEEYDELKVHGVKVVIRPFSESIQFNYCPICGNQISKNIKPFDEYHDHIIYIEE